MTHRPIAACLFSAAMAAAACSSAYAGGAPALWHKGGDAIANAPCSSAVDALGTCKALVAQTAGHALRLGEGYVVTKLLWKAPRPKPGMPDVIVLGDFGGSGGNADVIAVTFARQRSGQPHVSTLSGDRLDGTLVRPVHGRPSITYPISIEFFNGMPHAGASIIPLPITHNGRDFALNQKALRTRHYSAGEWHRRERAMDKEFSAWLAASAPTARLYPPMATTTREGTISTVETLGFLMLSGHARQARQMLHRHWPHDPRRPHHRLGGEGDFWRDLCQSLIRNPAWKRFQLSGIPQAAIILQGAKGGTSSCMIAPAAPRKRHAYRSV